jgi:hypothetical protein
MPCPASAIVYVPFEKIALPAAPVVTPTSKSPQELGRGCVVTAKLTGLLSFMFGARLTTREPEVAPVGIVNTMDVLLQVLIVIGTAFSDTRLPPCVDPKLEPVIVTWLPIDPVVADKLEITGAGAAAELIDTPSNVAVFMPLWLAKAKPTYALCDIVTVADVPICIQLKPSQETNPVKVLPLLTSFTQYGYPDDPNAVPWKA